MNMMMGVFNDVPDGSACVLRVVVRFHLCAVVFSCIVVKLTVTFEVVILVTVGSRVEIFLSSGIVWPSYEPLSSFKLWDRCVSTPCSLALYSSLWYTVLSPLLLHGRKLLFPVPLLLLFPRMYHITHSMSLLRVERNDALGWEPETVSSLSG